MARTTIPQFLWQLAYAVARLVQTSGLEHWRKHVRQWAAQTDADEREGLPLLDLPMELSLDEKYTLLAAVHDARARVEGGTQIDPWPDGYYTTYCVLRLRVVPFPQAGEAGLDESQASRLLSILREVAADLEESSRLWTPDHTSDAHPRAYSDPVDEFERFLKEQSKPVDRRAAEPPGVVEEGKENRQPANGLPGEPADVTAAPKRPKRSTAPGGGRAKLIAALTKHHEYANGGALNQEPIGVRELARQAEVDPSTASVFFNEKFNKGKREGWAVYRRVCREVGLLVVSLKALNDELAPHDFLFGRRPPGEDDRGSDDGE